MAGTIVTDRIESDASYASSINIASPMVVSNTLTMGSAAAITGNVNIDSGLLFVDAVNNRVGVNTQNPETLLAIKHTALTSTSDVREIFINSPANGSANSAGALSGITFRFNTTAYTAGSFDRSSGIYGINLDSDAGGVYGRRAGLTFRTAPNDVSSIERMRIDSDGRITTPYQPAFRAKPDANYDNIAQGAGVPFKTIVFDKNNNYNATTSRFTAPVAGVYFFTAAVYVMTNVAINSSLAMNKNGTFFAVGELHNVSGNLGYGMLTIACCTELAVNDYVDLSMRINQGHLNSNFNNYFSGFLVG